MIALQSPHFCWATGIENTFIPQVRPGLRRLDEYELTQHYSQWQSDLDLVAETGVQAVRWGIPWYRVQPTPDSWDWSWTDAVLEYMVNVKGIEPILDLMHYGTPLWLENSFINASYPDLVAEYAAAALERYRGLVHFYTPLNEPAVNANMCGNREVWPPYLAGEDGFVKVILALARGIVRTVQTLQAAHPDLVSVQVEALWHNWTTSSDPEIQERVAIGNARQYLSFDLCTGRVDERYPLYAYLRANGVTDEDLAWFQDNRVDFSVFGANYYPWGYGEVRLRKDGRFYRLPRQTSGSTLAGRLIEVHDRYAMPIMVTETSAKADVAGRARWMDDTIQAVCQLRSSGLPLVGYTWFPLFTMFRWDYRTGRRPLNHYSIHLGLYDASFDSDGLLRRYPTPLVARYHQHITSSMSSAPERS